MISHHIAFVIYEGIDMSELVEKVKSIVDEKATDELALRVLEAGCGSMAHIQKRSNWHVTGIDISRKQLDRNEHIDEKICGDLQTYEFPSETFDMIICWWVLEHLSRPKAALRGFIRWIKPGGLIVLAVPNVLSFKGLVTKFAPHWFHVWVYRKILKRPDAGVDDQAPFKAYMRLVTAPHQLVKFAEEHGLSIRLLGTWEADYQQDLRRKIPPLNWLWMLVEFLLRIVSFGRLKLSQTECIVVLQRPPESVSEPNSTCKTDLIGSDLSS